MQPIYYTVQRFNGDYAILISDEGIENTVSLALLPLEIYVETRVLCENFEYTII